jgi:hypothetical protein
MTWYGNWVSSADEANPASGLVKMFISTMPINAVDFMLVPDYIF